MARKMAVYFCGCLLFWQLNLTALLSAGREMSSEILLTRPRSTSLSNHSFLTEEKGKTRTRWTLLAQTAQGLEQFYFNKYQKLTATNFKLFR